VRYHPRKTAPSLSRLGFSFRFSHTLLRRRVNVMFRSTWEGKDSYTVILDILVFLRAFLAAAEPRWATAFFVFV